MDAYETFLLECDRLKTVVRRAPLADNSRNENSAEHSWHLHITLLALEPFLPKELDTERVKDMLAVHDLPEIYAGDTPAWDAAARSAAAEPERAATHKLFSLLPKAQSERFFTLWEEFEARRTPEEKVAYAMDRLQPLFQHLATRGVIWQKEGITMTKAAELLRPVVDALPSLGPWIDSLQDDAEKQGYFAPDKT